MKSNFVVSMCRDLWITKAKSIFCLNPYILHKLERSGQLSAYEEINVAKCQRTTREELQYDHDFVDLKYRKYLPILAKRLDELHGVSYGELFWNKAFSLSVLRHISICYELFNACEVNLNLSIHDCHVLDQGSYIVPSDFDEHRAIFQDTDLGREQLFSIYCGLFFPGHFNFLQVPAPICPTVSKQKKNKFNSYSVSSFLKKIASGILARIYKLPTLVCRWLGIQPTMVVMNCSFSLRNIECLVRLSRGKIQRIDLPSMYSITSETQWLKRDYLTRPELNFDRFDQFAFECLRYGMPKMFVENFHQTYQSFSSFFRQFSALRWVVCEWWIGQTISSFALAVLSRIGVRHISHEHNYLSHIFLGSNIKYLAPLADEYVTLGWEDASIPNVVKGASLFQWVEKDSNCSKEHKILFILAAPIAYVPEMSAAYGDNGAYGVISYFGMNKRFLKSLGKETLCQMYIRAYPLKETKNWLVWDQRYVLEEYVDKVKVYDDSLDVSARILMQRARLVVVSYMATSYLESLIANIPTILFFKKESNFLAEKYMNVFDEFIEVGICQTNPEKAAAFINKIKDCPEDWWSSDAVQSSRKKFLNIYIGAPDRMIQHLLNKARVI